MSGGGQGSSGQGGFGQQGMGYGGFGQGYGGFGGFQTPYASQQSYGGYQAPSAPLANISQYYAPSTATEAGSTAPYYGTFGNFSARDLQNYVGGLKTNPAQTVTAAPSAAPSISDLASASGNSGNAAWDKLVTDYTASHPNFQPGRGWDVNDYTKNEYQGLLDQYNKQNAATAAATPAVPTLDSVGAQNMAAAMQRYGVSANDLAQSGALSQADYTRAFRPGNQYQGVTNPTQYYQPIYQSQYQNYYSPAYYPQAYQNNMMQGYQSPLRGGYGGYGIDGLLGQLGGYLQQYLGSYMKSAPAQSTPAQTTTTSVPAESTPAQTTASVPAESTPAVSKPAQTTTASTPAVSTPAVSTPKTYGNQNVSGQQIKDYFEQYKGDPKKIIEAAKAYGLSEGDVSEVLGYSLNDIKKFQDVYGAKAGGLMSLMRNR